MKVGFGRVCDASLGRERHRRGAGRRRQAREAVDAPALLDHVEPPCRVFAEGDRVVQRQAQRAVVAGPAAGARRQLQGADRARAEVGVDVAAVEGAEARVADHVTADDRAAAVAAEVGVRRVRIVEGWWDEGVGGRRRAPGAGRRTRQQALLAVPAVVGVGAAGNAREGAWSEVDLLARVQADVADRHVAGEAVEGEAEGVAQAGAPDRGCRRGRVRVEAEDLAELAVRVLGVWERLVVLGAAPVAGRDVESAVGADLQLAAVVVGGVGVVDSRAAVSASPDRRSGGRGTRSVRPRGSFRRCCSRSRRRGARRCRIRGKGRSRAAPAQCRRKGSPLLR